MKQTPSFTTIAVAHITFPHGRPASLSEISHLAAIGLLIADRDADGEWHFSLKSHAAVAGDGEDKLLAWATHALPPSGILVGWQLAERILPPLLDASGAGDPDVGRAFLDRLLQAVTALSVDLAIPHGGACAPSLANVVARHGIPVSDQTPVDIESAWAFGNRALLIREVEAEAIAAWRLWLAEGNGIAAPVATAFERWLDR